jgi:hypothetical protein
LAFANDFSGSNFSGGLTADLPEQETARNRNIKSITVNLVRIFIAKYYSTEQG